MNHRFTFAAAGLILALGGNASGEDDRRGEILRSEMRREPTPLGGESGPELERLARRALGRIGTTAGADLYLRARVERGDGDLPETLFWAGVAQSKKLSPAIARHVDASDPVVRAAACEALGWCGEPADVAKLSPMLADPAPEVVAAALRGLARLKVDGLLERVWPFQGRDEPVESSALFAAWFLAGARQQVSKARNPEWDGEPLGGFEEVKKARGVSEDLIRLQLGWLRTVSRLAPKSASLPEDFTKEMAPRVAQEYVARFCKDRTSDEVKRTLLALLGEADEKTRTAAVEEIGSRDDPESLPVLQGVLKVEKDARVRDVIAIALAKRGDEDGARAVLERPDRPEDPVVRQSTKVEVLALSKLPDALQDLFALGRVRNLHAAVKMLVLDRLEKREAAEVSAFAKEMLGDPDPYVRAAAAALIGKKGLREHLPALQEAYDRSASWGDRATRQEVVGAWALLAKDEKTPKEEADALRTKIAATASADPSAPVRLAARTAAKELGIEGVPPPEEDPKGANDWRGLPRPKAPLLGLEFPPEKEWLDEADILRIADRIASQNPHVRFETTQGAFTVSVDAKEAPVHSVNLLICVVNGVYENTRWHRVVPSFVIQGGDPHGDGSGDAGYCIPDEITHLPFVRGALGMPKDTKDTGGCQVFVMHSDYMPLDGRYTCYGKVVSGMDVVDKIRVGDFIRKAAIVP